MKNKLTSEVKLIKFNEISDDRGKLISLESNMNMPFNIERVYYLFDTQNGVERGFHAHIDLQQVAICLSGSCTIDVEHINGKTSFNLDSPDTGLFMGGLVWREIRNISNGCVLMVAADALYTEDDYIRDYATFKNHLKLLTSTDQDLEKQNVNTPSK